MRKIPIFAGLGDEDLSRLCKMIKQLDLPAGAVLFEEGEMGDTAYVIQQGEIEIFKNSGGRSIHLALRKEGEIIGEMSLLEAAPRNASGRAKTDSILLVVHHDQLNELVNTSPTAARSMLETFSARIKSMDLTLQQSEKMAQLGILTAGLAHELNNPAAAVRRGSEHLGEAVRQLELALIELNTFKLTEQQQQNLELMGQAARHTAGQSFATDPLARSDFEEEIELWLDDHRIEDAWELAPSLAGLEMSFDQLTRLLEPFSDRTVENVSEMMPVVVRWLSASRQVETLLLEIHQGAGRIAEIIKSVKSYTYLDQDEVQLVDIHEGLQNTLIILRGALGSGITLRFDYAPDLPRIQAYGSELNQVWTNLIANAIDAVNGEGEILLRTRHKPPWVVVEVQDSGPGIPEGIKEKLFSPFFTTKPVAKGTGLGLHISYNIIQKHHGDIRVFSRPGCTRFVVTLPVQSAGASGETAPLNPQEIIDHDTTLDQ